MKDYYHILGISEKTTPGEIKKAFRKLAFQYHPDTNRGNEKEAEQKFKEINEAFGVLGDPEKRRQYDLARQRGVGYTPGATPFGYSQDDIFQGIFANRAMVEELNSMFAQAGLRFDQDFMNQVFFGGKGFTVHVFTPGTIYRRQTTDNMSQPQPLQYKPGLVERASNWLIKKLVRFVLRLLVVRVPAVEQNLDQHMEFEVTAAEAASGAEKPLTYRRGNETKNLIVKIPAGIRSGTRIRLNGLGIIQGRKRGDVYLHIRVRR